MATVHVRTKYFEVYILIKFLSFVFLRFFSQQKRDILAPKPVFLDNNAVRNQKHNTRVSIGEYFASLVKKKVRPPRMPQPFLSKPRACMCSMIDLDRALYLQGLLLCFYLLISLLLLRVRESKKDRG